MYEHSAIFSIRDLHSAMEPIRIEGAKTSLKVHRLSHCPQGRNGRFADDISKTFSAFLSYETSGKEVVR